MTTKLLSAARIAELRERVCTVGATNECDLIEVLDALEEAMTLLNRTASLALIDDVRRALREAGVKR